MAFVPKILFVLALGVTLAHALRAQQIYHYDSRWKIVDSLAAKKGLTRQALQEISNIYTLAKKEKQDAQLIRALIYQLHLQQETDETGTIAITRWQQEIETAAEPSKSILLSIQAEAYLNYFQQHRWQIYHRMATTGFNNEDITTWAADDFHKKITAAYLASIKKEKLLQATRLETFDPILVKGNMRYLRPTLFDLLVQRALAYFKNNEHDIAQPAYTFEIDDSTYFAPAAKFSRISITAKDSTSLYLKALQLYQALLAFHLHNSTPEVLVDADIARLQLVHEYGVMENKERLYEQALDAIVQQHPLLPAAAQAAYLVAEQHANRANAYQPRQYTDSGAATQEYSVAAAICRQVLAQPNESEGKTNCYNLLRQIEKKELQLTTEKVNLPQLPFRTLVSYRNCDSLYLRVIAADDALLKKTGTLADDNAWQALLNQPALQEWKQELPAGHDYRKHSVEIKVDALPQGHYMILASAGSGFPLAGNPLAVQQFYVSRISYIANGNEYFVLDRQTGHPLEAATMQTWWTQYDYNSRSNKKIKGEKGITDKNGYLRLENNSRYPQGSLQLDIQYHNDRLFMPDLQYMAYREDNPEKNISGAAAYEKEHARVFLFTDRNIYRPGQTVYFKGIAITRDFYTHKYKPYEGCPARIFLHNANDEEIDSLQLKTNAYGSYSGKFVLPPGGLNGQFALEDRSLEENIGFSVEAYKRPSFYVEYKKPGDIYRLNDSIVITGFAKAYAGNNITGAQVAYRVQRVARFIHPWLYDYHNYPAGSNMEISHGILSTRADGTFSIRFKAIPDLQVSKELDPVFDYRLTADITDINGETRSAAIIVPVSYKALQLKLQLPESQPADSLDHIPVAALNFNGEPVPALVNLNIRKLQSPGRLVRKRYWTVPDQFAMTEAAFLQNFPNDEYRHETDYRSWATEKITYSSTDSIRPGGTIPLSRTAFIPGWYAVEVSTKDRYGETVKDIQYIQLTRESQALTVPTYAWFSQESTTAEPGQTAAISIGSAAADLFLVQAIDRRQDAGIDDPQHHSAYHFFSLNHEKRSFDFTPAESDRGGFGVYHFFVKDNRFYFFSHRVNVPWSNKELHINYETFRDKTLPGSEEKWKLHISGYKKEKIAAEVLAAMYDASLDQFRPQSWSLPGIWDSYTPHGSWTGTPCFAQVQSQQKFMHEPFKTYIKNYDYLNTMISNPPTRIMLRGISSISQPQAVRIATDEEVVVSAYSPTISGKKQSDKRKAEDSVEATSEKEKILNPPPSIETMGPALQIRRNFNETAFFFPDLQTDSAGNISFSFTMPEALTRWKFQALSHTRDLSFGYSSNTVTTQKILMVRPYAPRFLRQGDKLDLDVKLVNMSDSELTGTVQLELINTATGQPVDGWFHNMFPLQYFTAAAGQASSIKFSIDVPYQYNSAVSYRFIARAGNYADGEEAALPVLTNSMLVTESMPLPMHGNGTRHFRFEKLLQSGSSETLQHHALTVEFTSNPAWYAVQALPYLMEYPYECAEQTFNRYYANALAAAIAQCCPRIKTVLDSLTSIPAKEGSKEDALLSRLEANPDLKLALLEETPWVLQAKDETRQKKNIALLFNIMRMRRELSSSLQKLQLLQSPNGGFVWFKGGPDDRYITQYIISSLGHLYRLNALPPGQQETWTAIIKKAVAYLDQRIKEDYEQLLKHKAAMDKDNLAYMHIQYLYLRSFFSNYPLPGASFTAVNYFRKQSQQFWLQQNKYMQGMIALSLFRSGDKKTAADIMQSLRQNAIRNEETGMYWKEMSGGYYWYQAPVETQSLLIEAFAEITRDNKTVDELRTWLLKQKQTSDWKTTRATADACYALLLQGSNWLNNTPEVEIQLGSKQVFPSTAAAGTGYFRQTTDGPFVKPEMGSVSVQLISPGQPQGRPAWGAVYWQYFEELDKITPAATPLQLNKKLFREIITGRGPVLEPIAENGYIQVGDKITVRITVRADRDMEYVHLKDMRAACLEPVNVLSGYKWQDGLGYYESTTDASTNFFFSRLPKGSYVLEYPLFVTHAGNFSNGIASIQCMYAPEFSSHSEGIRVNAEDKK